MGRPAIFTEEVLSRIRLLVDDGLSREDIAQRLGVKFGSLVAICCKHRISLRPVVRPRPAPSIPVIRDIAPAATVDMTIQISPLAKLQLGQHAALKGIAATTLAAQLLETIANDSLYDAVLDPE